MIKQQPDFIRIAKHQQYRLVSTPLLKTDPPPVDTRLETERLLANAFKMVISDKETGRRSNPGYSAHEDFVDTPSKRKHMERGYPGIRNKHSNQFGRSAGDYMDYDSPRRGRGEMEPEEFEDIDEEMYYRESQRRREQQRYRQEENYARQQISSVTIGSIQSGIQSEVKNSLRELLQIIEQADKNPIFGSGKSEGIVTKIRAVVEQQTQKFARDLLDGMKKKV